MKKTNKKGFTLAELLIVIAIIAILIAIAIPAFGGALENAKRQTDHANIRSAYAIAQVANLNGGFLDENGELDATLSAKTALYFQQDGTVAETGDGDYVLKVVHVSTDDKCSASAVCKKTNTATTAGTSKIKLTKNTTTGLWSVELG